LTSQPLQALSVDETNWLDNFFLTNVTPLFLIETLADLEKEVGAGRTPKDVVGHLALRTPDMQAYPCTHHRKLIGGDLYGTAIPMDGRIPCDSGKVVNLNDKRGVFFSRTKEEEALQRWYKGEFLDVERQIAKTWRRELCDVDYEHSYLFFQKWFLLGRPKSVAEVKTMADAYIDGSPQDGSLKFGMTLLDIPEAATTIIAAPQRGQCQTEELSAEALQVPASTSVEELLDSVVGIVPSGRRESDWRGIRSDGCARILWGARAERSAVRTPWPQESSCLACHRGRSPSSGR